MFGIFILKTTPGIPRRALIAVSWKTARVLDHAGHVQQVQEIRLDCDVLQADGGTRTAAITGAYVALHLACQNLVRAGELEASPLTDMVAAVSCGIYEGVEVLDLDYDEDSNAQADANFVLTAGGRIIEVQGTAEGRPFTRAQFVRMLDLARHGTERLAAAQRAALGVD